MLEPRPDTTISPLQPAIDRASRITALQMLESTRNHSSFDLVVGPMGGAKSSTLAYVAKFFGGDITAYKLAGDNRFGSTEKSIGSRNGIISGDVKAVNFSDGIAAIIDDITNSRTKRVVLIDEIQFIGMKNIQALTELIKISRARGIHLKAGALGAWHTTVPIDETLALAASADRVFLTYAWDDLNKSSRADTNIRLVGIDEQGGIIPPHKEDAVFLRNVDAEMRLQMVKNLKRNGYEQFITMRHPEGAREIEVCYGIPSHPQDAMLALGSDRYRSTTRGNRELIFAASRISLGSYPEQYLQQRLQDNGNLYPW